MTLGLGIGLALPFGGIAAASPANPLPPALSSPLWGFRADNYTVGATATWTDQSGQGKSATNAAALGTHPTLNAVGTIGNSQPTLGFAAASSQILTTPGITSTQPIAVFAVLKLTTNGANQVIVDSTGDAVDIFYNTATAKWSLYGGAVITSSSGAVGPLVMCAVFNGASAALYINDSSTNLLSGNPGSTALVATAVAIGASTTLASFFNGEMADCWAYGISPSLAQRQAWFAYAANRYAQAWS